MSKNNIEDKEEISSSEEPIEEEVIVEDIKEENLEEIKEHENTEVSTFKQVVETKKSHKTLLVISIAVIAIIVLLFIFSTIFALVTANKTTIIHGIKIKDIDVSGLTKEEAIAKVSSAFEEKLEKQITLKHNEYELTVFASQFDVSFSIEEAVDIAYAEGRTRKYFSK